MVRIAWMCALGLVLGANCFAQDTAPAGQASPAGQGPGQGSGPGSGPGSSQDGQGRRGITPMGRGIMGMVTEVAPDHFLVKDAANDIYTIHYSANTRIMKQPAGHGRNRNQDSGQAPGADSGPDRTMGSGGTPPTAIKAGDIKVGDAIAAGGETDDKEKSVGAVFVMLLDPDRAKAMRAWQSNFGKTWLMGKVTGISETRVTVHSGVDNADHNFVADESTTFRKQREPITLGDVQVGDSVRIEGAVKDGQFVAATVNVMAFPAARGGPVKPPGDTAPR